MEQIPPVPEQPYPESNLPVLRIQVVVVVEQSVVVVVVVDSVVAEGESPT